MPLEVFTKYPYAEVPIFENEVVMELAEFIFYPRLLELIIFYIDVIHKLLFELFECDY